MRFLGLTLPTIAENVALDEALLEWAEDEDPAWEFLRIWESPLPAVVVGRSSRVHQEVNVVACREQGIDIVRRTSGGAAIVAGPGCLMYAVVLSYKLRPELKDIRRAHAHVLGRHVEALQPVLAGLGNVAQTGTSDLAFVATDHPSGGARSPVAQKFSGNSLRARRSHLLYHGTLLYNFDLCLLETCLRVPARQPDYRDKRSHADFVSNLPLARPTLVDALQRAWPTDSALTDWPAARVAALVADRFGRESWNYEFP
ncbi:MAG: lipoate--protein ligase family protein [Planctomycetes bacterium]|nr:lipoate--protein ligase family protein [Planctomycetota bacterium]